MTKIYWTSGDVAQNSPLRGQQVHYFLQDYGTEINGRMTISESLFRKLDALRITDHYRSYPMWNDHIRNRRRKPYKKRVVKRDDLIG